MARNNQETPETQKVARIFNEIMAALHANDENKIAELMRNVKLADYPGLPYIADEKGNTLAHAICQTGNRAMAMHILMSNEQKFAPSFYIRNANNQRPIDCVPEGNASQKFKENIKRNLMSTEPSFSQDWIIGQFKLYLQYQAAHHPDKYSTSEVDRICSLMENGQCFGFSSLWGQSCLDKDFTHYPTLFHDICAWDREYDHLEKSLILKFETLISSTRSLQEMPDEIEKDYQNNKNTFFSKELQHAKDFRYTQVEPLKTKSDSESYEIEKNWGAKHYQCESNLFIFANEAEKLRDYFSHFIRAENNNKVLMVTSLKHSAAFFLHNDHLYFFNSNTDFALLPEGNYPDKPLGVDIDTSKDTCMAQIIDCLEDCYHLSQVAAAADDPWGPRVVTMNIRAMDLIGKKLGEYSMLGTEAANFSKK